MHVEKADDDISLIFDGILVVVIFLFANMSLSKSSLFGFVLPNKRPFSYLYLLLDSGFFWKINCFKRRTITKSKITDIFNTCWN